MSYNEALSQPVAYTDREELESMRGPNADTYANLWTIPHGCGQDLALYSQEYVTALLAENAELKASLSEWEDCKHDGATYHDMSGRERCGRCGADL
ncbi:hypothetical protein [Serratia fonticola]